jgi:hypothetical protein
LRELDKVRVNQIKNKRIKNISIITIMFKRLIISNRFFIRGSRDLFKKTTGSTPTGTSSGSFPYKFGGIANHPSNDAGI